MRSGGGKQSRGRGGKPAFRPHRHQDAPNPGAGPLTIVHEDADVLVVNKPAGLLSSRAPGEERESLFDQVKDHVRGRNRKTVRVWIIHRLDKEASGLLVFAKTEKAFNWLKEDLRARRMHRLYVAVVEGEIGAGRHEGTEARRHEGEAGGAEIAAPKVKVAQLPCGTIQSFIRDDESGNVTSVGVGDLARESARARRDAAGRDHGFDRPPHAHAPRFMGKLDPDAPRLAVTHWRVLGTGQGRSLLQLRLETGRKNQIRVHMQEFKHPIVGDARYGAASNPIGRLALHAAELGFTHPGTGQTSRFSSPAPAAFYRAVGMVPARGSEAVEREAWAAPLAPPAAPEPSSAAAGPRQETPADRSGGAPAASTSWDSVAAWYDRMIEEERSDHFRHVIVPGTLRLLRPEVRPPPAPPMRVLDIACGQGALCRRLAETGLEALGVDASPSLIEAARKHASRTAGVRFEVGDARFLTHLPRDVTDRPFDAAACVMALMNIDPLEPVLRGAAALLRPGGALVAVILHPAFRSPGQTSWGWEQVHGRPIAPARDNRRRPSHSSPHRSGPRASPARQYRRVDGYLSTGQMPITMNPGFAAHGAEPIQTWTFHRPIQSYVRAFVEAGLLIEVLEEWPSMRRSQPGPRAAEEDRARREIPMFLGIRAIKAR